MLACMIIIVKIVTEDENIEAGDMVNNFFKIKAFVINKE